ncbi:MAG: allantoicase, partial [Acidimicrobiia bacterium]
ALIRLGLPGIIRHIVADTSHFAGNYPEACSIEACELEGEPSLVELVRDPSRWSEIMERTPLLGDTKNHFPVEGSGRATHVRFVIYPDGGVARLRLFGEVVPGPDRFPEGQEVDLAAIENGGRVIDCSDHHFSVPNNMLMPGDAEGMHDGWETRRRRGPGHDWAIVKLGVAGEIKRIVVDTSHFKGNAPGSCDLETVNAPAATVQRLQGAEWTTLLPATKLEPDRRQALEDLNEVGRVTHVRFNIHPDGGVARLRLFGTAARS